jgi:hypothetical protein
VRRPELVGTRTPLNRTPASGLPKAIRRTNRRKTGVRAQLGFAEPRATCPLPEPRGLHLTASNPGLTSGLPRVVQGLSGEPADERAVTQILRTAYLSAHPGQSSAAIDAASRPSASLTKLRISATA